MMPNPILALDAAPRDSIRVGVSCSEFFECNGVVGIQRGNDVVKQKAAAMH